MLEGLLRGLAREHYRFVINGHGFRAADEPVAAQRGTHARRVLLVSSGVSSGWGVASHQLALTGLLRDALQAGSTYRFDVELVGDEVMNVSTAIDWIGDRARRGWDAVVVAIGVNDASRLVPMAQWEREYEALVQRLRADLAPAVPMVLAGVPPISSIVPLRGPLARIISAHAQRMNDVVQRIAIRANDAVFVSLPRKATEEDRPWGSPDAYRPWATALSSTILDVLPSLPASIDEPFERALRASTQVLMHRAYRNENIGLQRLVEEAAREFGAGSVQVNLLDGDRTWIAADSSRSGTRSLPRRLTYCDVTMQDGELQVPDARDDPRFCDNALLELTGLNSYAGIVVHDPDGGRVGTVCLFNGAVRRGVERAALATLARRVEDELAHPTGPSTPAPTQQAHEETEDEAEMPSGLLAALAGSVHLRARGSAFARRAQRDRLAPRDVSRIRIEGPEPIRVLLFGGDYAVGHGVATRAAAMDGAIADLLHERTGRGVTVENRSDDTVRLHELPDRLGPAGAADHDLVVWTPTFTEAARYMTLRPWRSSIEAMLVRIRQTSEAGVVLLGIPALQGPQPIAVLARRRSRQIEQVLRAIAERFPRTLVVDPPPLALREVRTVNGSDTYYAAAQRALPAMLEVLNIRLLAGAPRR